MATLPVWLKRAQTQIKPASGFARPAGAAEQAVPDSAASATSIKAQQIELLYQNSFAGIAAGCVMFLVAMAAMLYLGVLTRELWLWGAANFICFAIGFAQLRAYQRASPESKAQPVWGQRIVTGGIVAGALWGLLTFFLDGPLKGHEIPVVSGMVLLLVGAVSGYAVYAPAIFGFSSGIALTSALGLILTPGPYHVSLAVMVLAVFASVVQFGLNLYRAYAKELVLDAQNRQLIASLTEHQLQLEAAHSARLQFFASASHDLRQPMHALGLFAEGLRDFVAGPQGQNVYQRMQTSITAMEDLIDHLLSVANMDAGAIIPKPVRLPVQYLFNSLQPPHETLAHAKGLRVDFMPTHAVINADPMLLGRLLGNLITNAIRYTERGRVLVGCRRRGEHWRIDVLDTGCGIAQTNFGRIFEEFVQLANPERDRSKGLGLGLAIVKRIAALLGYRVSVASKLGHGSRFSVTIPRLAESAEETLEDAAERAEAPADVAGLLIVVIDDERDIRDALEALLMRWGAFVVTATSEQEAVQKLELEARLPDLLICDLRLADNANGIELITKLREHFELDVPAVLVSGDTAPQRLAEAQAAGLHLAHKPLNAQKLRALIAQALRPNLSAPSPHEGGHGA
jgi:two-component system, sensor histidine kinase